MTTSLRAIDTGDTLATCGAVRRRDAPAWGRPFVWLRARVQCACCPRENSKTRPTRPISPTTTPTTQIHQPTATPMNRMAAPAARTNGHQECGENSPYSPAPCSIVPSGSFTDKISSDYECLSKSVRTRLDGICKINAKLMTVTKQIFKSRCILRSRYDKNITDSCIHKHRHRIINHRLIIYRQQLFRCYLCQWVKSSPRPTG